MELNQKKLHLNGNGGIDLNKVYWLKLPNMSDDSVHQKVKTVFGEVIDQGKDVLIIPVSREFTSGNEIAQGFWKSMGHHDLSTFLPYNNRRRARRRRLKMKMDRRQKRI
jgi:hypothetical protein